MSDYVVDASVAAKWYLDEENTAEARRLLDSESGLHAPDIFLLELDNLFCKRVRRGQPLDFDADSSRLLLRSVPIDFYPFGEFLDFAYDLAMGSRCSVYDCLYLALAIRLQVRMVTADRRFFDQLAETPLGRYLVWIEDVP